MEELAAKLSFRPMILPAVEYGYYWNLLSFFSTALVILSDLPAFMTPTSCLCLLSFSEITGFLKGLGSRL